MAALKKKPVQMVLALALVGAIILAGTFAWFNFTQNALNVLDGFTNPDVNLHDDFWEPNKDVYVENSGQQPLYVRVQMEEWMTINGLTTQSRQGAEPFKGVDDVEGWLTHTNFGTSFDNCGEAYHDSYNWIMGDKDPAAVDPDKGGKYFLPAPFSTRAQFNETGDQVKEPGVVTNVADKDGKANTTAYGTDADYTATVLMEEAYTKLKTALDAAYAPTDGGTEATVREKVDALYKAADDAAKGGDAAALKTAQTALDAFLGDPANGLGYYDKVFTLDASGNPTAESTVKWVPIQRTIQTAKIYTMAQWIAAGTPTGDFWIMDNDGWCYWGNVLMPGQATGLLLSEVELNEEGKPAGKWQYKINAKLQAVTFNDVAKFGETVENNGGGGITDEGSMVLMAVSGDYAFDWKGGATGEADPVYTFKNYNNNVYAQMTSDGTNITYGDRFIYTGTVPPANKGELFSGDAGYKDAKTFNKNTTGVIGTGNTTTTFTVAGKTLVEGANGDWYLKLSYPGQPADSDVYLAVGANRKFDALTTTATPAVSDNDDILIWVAKDTKPGSGEDRKVENAAAAVHKTGDEYTIDGVDFMVIGKETRADKPNTGKTLIISKQVLVSDVATADITAKLEAYAKTGVGTLTKLVAADATATAQLLTIQDAMDYFANNADRIAKDGADPAVSQRWWLAGDAIIGTNGAFETAAKDETGAVTDANVGVRVAIWVNTEAFEGLAHPVTPIAP